MATVSSLGVGSGLDLSGLLTKLMQSEAQPLTLLKNRSSAYEAKISAYGSISSKLSTLETAASSMKTTSKQTVFKASSSDTDVATATAGSTASDGAYSINVTALAKSHTLATGTFTDDPNVTTDGENTVIGEGTLRIGVGGDTFDVTIDSSNSTLAGIRDAVNASASNTGVTATIITDTNGARLVFAANDTGTDHALTVDISESGTSSYTSDNTEAANKDTSGLSKLAYITGTATNLSEPQPAADATLTINSISVTSSSNTLTTAITGVTLKLADTGSTTLTVSRDQDALNTLVNTFISAYNDVISTTRNYTKYDTASKTASTLTGEGTANSVINTLRQTLYTTPSTVSGSYDTLSDLGITMASDGTLSLNTTTFQKAVDADFASVQSVLTGYGTSIYTQADSLTSTSGTVTARVTGLNSLNKLLTDRADAMQTRLTNIEARYRKQFSSLDTLVSQMNGTSSYLSQQLSKLLY